MEKAQKKEFLDFNIGVEGILRYRNRLVVSKDEDLKREILEETHRSKYTVHPEGNKMYQNMKSLYWWEGMKKEIARFVQTYLVCQRVKAEHQKPSGLLQSLEVAV